VKFINKNYECKGPGSYPLCKYDYVSLAVLNQVFCFSVPTEHLPTQKNRHWKKYEESKQDSRNRLKRGTNMLKLVDENFLDDYGKNKN
jgi:hypothetical protein